MTGPALRWGAAASAVLVAFYVGVLAASAGWSHLVDQARTDELTRRIDESLVPKLSKLPGFKGYYLIEAGDGVMSSLGLFESPEQSDESTKVISSWFRDEKLEAALPNPPKITTGKVVAHKNGFVSV